MVTNILYRAGYGWKGRALSLLYVCFWGIFFFRYPDSLLRYWQEAGWIGRACEVIFLLFMPLGLLDTFITSTVFTDKQIDHRSMFGVKTAGDYASVERIVLNTNFLKIYFVNGQKIKIWRAQGDLGKMVSIIEECAGRVIPIETTP
jgi:hypothetical protein